MQWNFHIAAASVTVADTTRVEQTRPAAHTILAERTCAAFTDNINGDCITIADTADIQDARRAAAAISSNFRGLTFAACAVAEQHARTAAALSINHAVASWRCGTTHIPEAAAARARAIFHGTHAVARARLASAQVTLHGVARGCSTGFRHVCTATFPAGRWRAFLCHARNRPCCSASATSSRACTPRTNTPAVCHTKPRIARAIRNGAFQCITVIVLKCVRAICTHDGAVC